MRDMVTGISLTGSQAAQRFEVGVSNCSVGQAIESIITRESYQQLQDAPGALSPSAR